MIRPASAIEREAVSSVPALDRSLDIIERLAQAPEGLTLSELSTDLKLPKNAVFRITQTLLARGYLTRDKASMRFALSQKLLALSMPRVGRISLAEASLEPMRRLRDATRETVQIGVRIDDQGVIIEQVEGLEALRIAVDVGLRFSLHNNAPGKLLLAHAAPDEQQALLARLDLVRSTEQTITDVTTLRRECQQIVAQGYAVDHAEADEGIHCVAAPICGPQRQVLAALWVSAPARRLPPEHFADVAALVIRAAQDVSRRVEAAS